MPLCPACKHDLSSVTAGPITVDVCSGGCGGIWFDNFELRRVDEPHEPAGPALLDVPRDPDRRVNRAQRRSCCKCDDVVMMRHFSSIKHQVEVDECPSCGSVWLDLGELAAIRAEFSDEAEKEQATDRFFSQHLEGLIVQARRDDALGLRLRQIFGLLNRRVL